MGPGTVKKGRGKKIICKCKRNCQPLLAKELCSNHTTYRLSYPLMFQDHGSQNSLPGLGRKEEAFWKKIKRMGLGLG
jgi:hypothetical protein